MPAVTVLPLDGYGKIRLKDANDNPLVGGKVYFYITTTSTPKDTYSDAGGTAANTNPVVLDSRGEASIYLMVDAAYSMLITDENDVPLFSRDPVRGLVDIGYLNTYTIPAFASLTEETAPAVGDFVPLRDISASGGLGADVKMTLLNMFKVIASFTQETDINPFTDPIAFYDASATAMRYFYLINGLIDGPTTLLNYKFTASVSSKALTLARKTKAGSDPSSSDQCIISHRSTTLTDGSYSQVTYTAAASLVIPSGATFGFTAAETGFIYVYECYDGTNKQIGASRYMLFSPGVLHTTTAIGTGSDDARTLYTTSALTSASVRLVGRIKIQTGAVAGEWDNAPTVVAQWHQGMRVTGQEVQRVYTSTGAVDTTTSTVPNDDTIPQLSTEGKTFISLAITPTDAINRLVIDTQLALSTSAAGQLACSIHQDSTENALVTCRFHTASTTALQFLHAHHEMAAGTTSATTFKVNGGCSAAGTVTLNGESSARKQGGVLNTYISIIEVQE